jgi:enoyl-CoA hydratase/carnithine racemase
MNKNETGITIDFGMKERKIAIIALKKEPANAMSLEFWEQLLSALEECEREEHGIRAVIFESTVLKDVFTAGNDINELYAPVTDRERYRKFWLVQTNFLTKLLVSKLVTIASIKGACPAGGTCLALCCDFRIQTKKDVWVERSHVRDSGAEVLGEAVRASFWQEREREDVIKGRVSRAFSCVEIWVDRRMLRLR